MEFLDRFFKEIKKTYRNVSLFTFYGSEIFTSLNLLVFPEQPFPTEDRYSADGP